MLLQVQVTYFFMQGRSFFLFKFRSALSKIPACQKSLFPTARMPLAIWCWRCQCCLPMYESWYFSDTSTVFILDASIFSPFSSRVLLVQKDSTGRSNIKPAKSSNNLKMVVASQLSSSPRSTSTTEVKNI